MTSPAIEVRDLAKDYGRRRVLHINHFAVERQSISALVGPNGSGKTTLLSLLALLEPPTAGSITLFGEEATSPHADRLALRRRVVMVHERPWMFHTTALGNVTFGLSARGMSGGEARQCAAAALETVGLAHAAEWAAPNLSAGEKQRVALARALAVQPDLMLLDEPMAGLDAQHAAALERVICGLPKTGATVLLATHRLETAYRLADQCVSLAGGRVSDVLPDNHFASIVTEEDGEPVMRIAPGCTLHLSTDLRGPAHVTIDPRTVILSREVPHSSARNSPVGRIAGLAMEGERVRVTVDVGVPIVALVTARSFREMDLHLGERIAVVFKTLSLAVYGGKPE